jgi:hypothetical protein
MASRAELEAIIQRQTAALQQQIGRIGELEAEIVSLRAENARLEAVIRDEGDALAHLRRLYTDPSLPTSLTLRAAESAVAYERARPPSVDVHLVGIADRLGAARAAYLERVKIEQSVDGPDDAA